MKLCDIVHFYMDDREAIYIDKKLVYQGHGISTKNLLQLLCGRYIGEVSSVSLEEWEDDSFPEDLSAILDGRGARR